MMAGMSVGPEVQRDASELGGAGAVTFANPETGNAIARITRTAGGRPGTGLVPRVWAARAVRTRIRVIPRLDCNPSASISCSSSSLFPTGRQPPVSGYIDTARKHGKNAMDILHELMPGRPWRPPEQAFSP